MFVTTTDRPIGVVFQDYLLFPRLTVVDNVAFGLRARGWAGPRPGPRRTRCSSGWGWPTWPGPSPGRCRAARPSGWRWPGPWPSSPWSCCSTSRWPPSTPGPGLHVRAELRRHLAGFPGARLLVTHDPVDALVLADRLVVLEAGRVTQEGTTAEVARRPRSAYVAELVGVNLLTGTAAGDHPCGWRRGRAGGGRSCPGPRGGGGRPPQAVTVHRHQPEGSARNAWPAHGVDLEADHDRVRVQLGRTGPPWWPRSPRRRWPSSA